MVSHLLETRMLSVSHFPSRLRFSEEPAYKNALVDSKDLNISFQPTELGHTVWKYLDGVFNEAMNLLQVEDRHLYVDDAIDAPDGSLVFKLRLVVFEKELGHGEITSSKEHIRRYVQTRANIEASILSRIALEEGLPKDLIIEATSYSSDFDVWTRDGCPADGELTYAFVEALFELGLRISH